MYRALDNYTPQGGNPKPLALWQLEQIAKPLLFPLQQYLDIRGKAGFANNPKLKNLKMYADKNGMVSPENIQRFKDDMLPITSFLTAEGATEPAQLQKYIDQQQAATPPAATPAAAGAAAKAPAKAPGAPQWGLPGGWIPRQPGAEADLNLPQTGEQAVAPAQQTPAQQQAAPPQAAVLDEKMTNDKIDAIVNSVPTNLQQGVREQLLQLVQMLKGTQGTHPAMMTQGPPAVQTRAQAPAGNQGQRPKGPPSISTQPGKQ